MKPGEWKLVKSCQCKGPSKPGSGFMPLPFCAICGKSWHIVGVLGKPSRQIKGDEAKEAL